MFDSAILGTVSTAIFVWLALRVFNRRERWAKYALIAYLLVIVGYPLNFGPVTWLASRNHLPEFLALPAEYFYRPLAYVSAEGPTPIRRFLFWYAELWSAPQRVIEYDDDASM